MREKDFGKWIEYEPDHATERSVFKEAYVCAEYARVSFDGNDVGLYAQPDQLRIAAKLMTEIAMRMETLKLRVAAEKAAKAACHLEHCADPTVCDVAHACVNPMPTSAEGAPAE